MSRFRIDALALAAQLCLLAGCAQQPYEAPAATPNPWADAPATQVAQAAAVEAPTQRGYAPQAPVAPMAPDSNVGGTRHGQRAAPPAPPAPVAAPTPPAPAPT